MPLVFRRQGSTISELSAERAVRSSPLNSPAVDPVLGDDLGDARARDARWSCGSSGPTLVLSMGRRGVHGASWHRSAAELMLGFVSLLDDLRRDRERLIAIAARHGARQLRVFGSVARREEQATSDVDVLVRFEPGRSLFDLCALGDELGDTLGRRVDVVTDAALSPYLRERIVSEAVAL